MTSCACVIASTVPIIVPTPWATVSSSARAESPLTKRPCANWACTSHATASALTA